MKRLHTTDSSAEQYQIPGAEGASLRVRIGAGDGAPNFTMLMLTIAPGGNTPYHQHPWEEEIFIISGEGKIVTHEGDSPIGAGDALFFASGEEHQFVNTGKENLHFICIIPHRSES